MAKVPSILDYKDWEQYHEAMERFVKACKHEWRPDEDEVGASSRYCPKCGTAELMEERDS